MEMDIWQNLVDGLCQRQQNIYVFLFINPIGCFLKPIKIFLVHSLSYQIILSIINMMIIYNSPKENQELS